MVFVIRERSGGGWDHGGRSPIVASREQGDGLARLASSRDRAEADRARAVLLTLRGWTKRAHQPSFRRPRGCRSRLALDVHALWRRRPRLARSQRTSAGEGASGAGRRRGSLVGACGGPAELDVAATRLGDRTAHGRHNLQVAALGCAAKKGGLSYRRPRHTLKGRQDADAVERVGLRLALRKAQAEAGDIVLLHADESEALTHPYLARAWAKRGADLRVPAPGQSSKVAMMGARNAATGELLVVTSKTKRSADFVKLLEEIDRLFGPAPGAARKPVAIVLDNGPIHRSKATTKALAARAHWLTVEWLPKYAPELNEIERAWRDMKSHHLAHQTFADQAELEDAIRQAVAAINTERSARPLANFRISA